MNKMVYGLIILGSFFIHGAVQAMSCEVDFRAKREVKESRWFGSVVRPEFRTGTVAGEGGDKKACAQDALSKIQAEGWKITYQRVRVEG